MKLLFAQLVVCIQFALGAVFTMAQDATILRDTLTAGGVSAVFPDDTTYANASSPCTYCVEWVDLIIELVITDNLRFHFKPFAIAYPTNASQVSTAIKAGSAQNLRVVARSGGVRLRSSCEMTFFLISFIAQLHCEWPWRQRRIPCRRSEQAQEAYLRFCD